MKSILISILFCLTINSCSNDKTQDFSILFQEVKKYTGTLTYEHTDTDGRKFIPSQKWMIYNKFIRNACLEREITRNPWAGTNYTISEKFLGNSSFTFHNEDMESCHDSITYKRALGKYYLVRMQAPFFSTELDDYQTYVWLKDTVISSGYLFKIKFRIVNDQNIEVNYIERMTLSGCDDDFFSDNFFIDDRFRNRSDQ